MKQYFRYANGHNMERFQVGLDVVLGDAVLDLIETGIHEDGHFWNESWHEIDDDDLEFAINDSTTMLKLESYIRPALVEKLREVLAKRRKEHARHPEVR